MNAEILKSLEITNAIISNKAFQRLAEKTQVVYPKNGRKETVQNRLTHSYQVANSAEIIKEAIKLPFVEIDYTFSLKNICLLHDIGHPPFGHEGAKFLNKFFKEQGLKEGFDDNNNNFVVIQKNQIPLNDYAFASLIKYPNKLYPTQRHLLKILDLAIKNDIIQFEKYVKIVETPKRTIACEIMDEADTNTYVCFDLADCYSLGLADEEPFVKILEEDKYLSHEIKEFLFNIIQAVKAKDKSLIKRAFGKLNVILNLNYEIGENLSLKPRNEELIKFRNELYGVENNIFINSEFVQKQKERHIQMFRKYVEWVMEGNYPSKTYKKLIEQTNDNTNRLRLIRDMVAETTDWYVFNKINELSS